MTSTLRKGTLGSVASLLAATLYQGNLIGTISSGISYHHHDLVDRYGIYVSQMITDMFHLS
jgi:hypothetical protein